MVTFSLICRTVCVVILCSVLSVTASGRFVKPTVRIHITVFSRLIQANRGVCPPSLCDVAPDKKARGSHPDTPFYNGDIVLDSQSADMILGKRRHKRAAMKVRKKLWKKGIVPYVFDANISPGAKEMFRRAIEHIQTKTCIEFRPMNGRDEHFVRFISEPGCWSNIGRVGGQQKLSLGRGCEFFGTAVHETMHALGFWHEQSRPDRNNYIRVVSRNISPRYIKDFERLNKTLVNSRGHPYDYSSIMHYDQYAFTETGGKTLQVIGPGAKMHAGIGQRQRLSDLDVAQILEVYKCPLRLDIERMECPKGWKKFERTCLRFVQKPPLQFDAAESHCKKLKSNLVAVTTIKKQKYIVKYLNWNKNFKENHIWRTAGRRVKGKFVWSRGTKKPLAVKYKNWAPNHPRTFDSIALVRDQKSKKFKWQGVWAGNKVQLPEFTYPYICEKPARRPCRPGEFKDGRDYRGKLHHTMSGIPCQRWSAQYPHQHNVKPKFLGLREDADGLAHHNYCRNPSGQRRSRPWCYTMRSTKEWQYCDVTTCVKS